MTDQPQAHDEACITPLVDGLTDYINGLDAPELMGELRCLTNSIAKTLEASGALNTGLGAAYHFLTVALSRFDAATPHPLPIAVDAVCRCSDPDGLTGQLSRLIGTMNSQRHDAPSPDLSDVAAQIAEAVKGIPGVSGATMVAVPMRGGQPVGDPIPLGEVKADEEPPAPGLYL